MARKIAVIASTIGILLAQPVLAQGGPPAAAVGVDAVSMVDINQTVPVIGRIVTQRSGTVAARVAGAVDKVYVEIGDRVETNDLLVEQDVARLTLLSRQKEAAAALADAAVATAQANVNIYQTQLERLERLKESAAYSVARVEDLSAELARAQSQLAEARARVAQAASDLALSRLDLAYAAIKAPFSGVITGRAAQPGAFLTIGNPVATILSDQDFEVEADVPATRIPGLEPGRTLSAELATGPVEITVRSVIPNENPLTRTRAVRFALTGPMDTGLAENEAVTIQIPVSARRSALSVHKDAVTQGPRGPMVFVVTEGKATPTPVGLGAAIGQRLEVLNGLKDGDIVVIRGNERLRPGQSVRYEGDGS